jgi:hypothetical protein
MAFTVEMNMGKLLEVRASGFRTVAEVDAMFQELASVVAAKSPTSKSGADGEVEERHVTVADWRQCMLMSGEAAARLQEGMKESNPNVIRAAAIASHDSPSAVMQFVRVVRDSQHEGRRLFFDEDELVRWLSEVLTLTETARLRIFLREEQSGAPLSGRRSSFPGSW